MMPVGVNASLDVATSVSAGTQFGNQAPIIFGDGNSTTSGGGGLPAFTTKQYLIGAAALVAVVYLWKR